MNTITSTCIMKNCSGDFVHILFQYDPKTMGIISSLIGFEFLNKKEMCEYINEKYPAAINDGVVETSIVYSLFGLFIKTNPYFNNASETCEQLCNGE